MTIFLDVSKRKTPEGPVHPFCAMRRDRPARQPEAPGAARALLCGPASVGRSPREPCFLPGGWCPGPQRTELGKAITHMGLPGAPDGPLLPPRLPGPLPSCAA